MATICAGSDKVEWRHWHQLATQIDDLAASLNTPGYEPLTSDTTLPFVEATLPQVEGVLELQISTSAEKNECPYVASKAILKNFNQEAVCFRSDNMTGANQEDFYADYIDAGRLFFVQEETDCFCKTIFKIVEEDACQYGLELVAGGDPQFGSCQTLHIPAVGEELGYGQNFIPAAYACQWGDPDGLNTGSLVPILEQTASNSLYCPACKQVSGTGAGGCIPTPSQDYVQFKFENIVDPENPDRVIRRLVSAARSVRGKLTWPILKEHMDKLFEKLDYILQCENNDGLRPEDLSHSPATVNANGGYISSNPTLWRKDALYETHGGVDTVDGWHMWGWGCGAWDMKSWLASLHFEFQTLSQGNHDVTLSGNIVQPSGGDAGSVSQCGASMLEPWAEVTGNAEVCGSTGGLKVYCETLNRISDLIDTIGKRLWAKGAFSDVSEDVCEDDDETVSCCSGNSIEGCTSMTRRACGASGGFSVASCVDDCCPDQMSSQMACENTNNPACPLDEVKDCVWNSTECKCECPTDTVCPTVEEYEYYCCCTSYCDGPFTAAVGAAHTCSEECTVGVTCDSTTGETYCEHPSGGSCDCANGSCESPCVSCFSGDSGCNLCSYTNIACSPLPVDPEPEYYVNLVPDPASCGDCDRPCCLKHAAFEETVHGCLEYLSEISAFVNTATDGTFTTCDYRNREISPGSPDCAQVTCGVHCESYLPGAMETCMNQAAFMWQLVETGSSSGWYELEISAPSAP